ncbi:MAG: ribosome biogenesis GTPase Der [Terriglobia bacterium]
MAVEFRGIMLTTSAHQLPTVAIIGRPNVGKSTLFNRICEKHKALVGKEAGMTRDRLSEKADWKGTSFEIIDTGGIIPSDEEPIARNIFLQAKKAIQQASVIVFVVDGRTGILPTDQELAKFLIQTSKPVLLAVNKLDHPKVWNEAQQFFELGLEHLFPISAEHALNIGDLLDAVVNLLPREESLLEGGEKEIRVAIVGKPNVGKSTLLNLILGEERSIVSPIPGTTRDAVDSLARRSGRLYRFIDTAGIRKKSQTELMAEKLSVIMARKSLDRCDVALVVVDASEGVSSLDSTIASFAQSAGSSVILVINKWDKVPKDSYTMLHHEEEIRAKMRYLDYAPILFISARTGQRVVKLFDLIDRVYAERQVRVTTGELNAFLQKVALSKAPVPFRNQVKVHYMTQVGVAPPVFALFTNRRSKIHFSLERYLVNQIRDQFGFLGTPILVKQKLEAKRRQET